MNPYYQYALTAMKMQQYEDANGESAARLASTEQKEGTTSIASAPIVGVASTPASQPYTPPTENPTIAAAPETIAAPDSPITSVGDTSQPIKDGTTINIFNPNGTTSTSTSAEDVSIDTLTGESETGTNVGGGGGGGFGGGGGMGEEEVVDDMGRVVAVRTWIPLIVMAAGVAIIILKPFKKAKAK